MQNIVELKKACLAEIERAYQIVEAKYGQSIPRVPVTFSNKLTKSAGNAGYRRNRATGTLTPTGIKLSLPLLKLNGETFVMDTPAHEAMHIATFALFDYAGHGTHWQNLMRLVGRSTSRCHQMETVQTNRVPATCNCKTHMITKQRANKMRRGYSYTCTICRSKLKLGGSIAPTPKKVEAPRVPTAPVAAPRSKAEVVKAAIKLFKQAGTALDQVLESNKVVQEIAAEAGLTAALCRTYLKNNWRKV